MLAIGTLGAIGAGAGSPAASAAAAAPSRGNSPPALAPGAAPRAGGAVHGLMLGGQASAGLADLEALALLALLAGRHANRSADALSAMLVALALNAYVGVQGMTAPAAAPAAGTGLNLSA